MPRDSVTQDSVECDDLDQMHELLLEADVVEGPPGLRDIVAEMWPGDLQRPLGLYCHQADVPRVLPKAPMLDAGVWLLRVDRNASR